ncbi:MAG: methyltransferase domain-containing protein [Firmicutes bacterium]|nr:methyltransferase domain-containing protein [Bacillota bacterium]
MAGMSIKSWIYHQSDSQTDNSISYRLRRKRMEKYLSFYKSTVMEEVRSENRRVEILDLGGEEKFWHACDRYIIDTSNITMLNLEDRQADSSSESMKSIVGDATDLSVYADQSVDLVFSNSVIEHVGDLSKMKAMADEAMRVGKHIYIQTPNKFFPIEPHFMMLFVQFLPKKLRVKAVAKKWNLSREEAISQVNGTELLSLRTLKKLFPGCKVSREYFFGMTKSFSVFR